MNDKRYNKFFNLCIILISLSCFCFFVYFSYGHSFLGDDMSYGIYSMGDNPFNGLLNDADKLHGGGFFSLLLTRFFCFTLPVLLNIHPADFMCWGNGCIQGVFLVLLFFSFLKFFPYAKKVKLLYTSFFLFTCTYFFFMLEKTGAGFIYSNNNNFWRYPFTFLFFNIFLLFLFQDIFCKNKKISSGQYVLVLISTVISAVNNDFLMFTGFCIFTLILGYDFIVKLFFKSKEYLHIKLTFKNFYVLVLIYISAAAVYLNSEAYKSLFAYRTNFNDFIKLKMIFADFLSKYIQGLFINYSVFWIVFVFLLIFCCLFVSKKKDFLKLIYPLFTILSSLIVMFSLIKCIFNGMGNRYWIFRETLQLTYAMLGYCSLLMLFDYLYKHWKRHKEIKIYLVSFLLILVSEFFISQIPLYNIRSYYKKSVNYISDKMLRFYYLNNETPILYRFTISNSVVHDNILNYNYMNANKEQIPVYYKDNMACVYEHPYILDYFSKTYGEDREKLKRLGVCYSYDAIERFYEKGGSFSEEELKNVLFTNLKEDSYVLEKKMPNADVKKYFRYILM